MRASLVILALVATAPLHAEVLPPDQAVSGKSQDEWSQVWWQWASSFEYKQSPVADKTGGRCASRQRGDVWFLAGTYGSALTTRTCRVPSGKHLFFPLINYVVMPRVGYRPECASFIDTAARLTDEIEILILEVDGRRVENLEAHRQATGCFDVGALANPPIAGFPSAANGYYVMLEPLSPGTHELSFGGVLPSMMQAVKYTLIVE